MYEKRILLFLDILGFKDFIKNRTQPEVLKVLEKIKSLDGTKDYQPSRRVTQFSDCLCISYDHNEQSNVFDLISDIEFLIIDLIQQDTLVRGAITFGELHHDDKFIFGPALNNAYELESKIIKYPVVTLSDDIVGLARNFPGSAHDGAWEEDFIKQGLLELPTDQNTYWFINYLSKIRLLAIGVQPNDLNSYKLRLQKIINNGLNNPCQKIVDKYSWLQTQLNKNWNL